MSERFGAKEMKSLAAFLLVCMSGLFETSAPAADAGNWPGFRGPTGLGFTREPGIPLRWGGTDGKNVL